MSCQQQQQLRMGGAGEKRVLGGNRGGISVGEIAIPASFFWLKNCILVKMGKNHMCMQESTNIRRVDEVGVEADDIEGSRGLLKNHTGV